MNNPFPSIYYVYHHVGDDGIDYIGYGSGDRAWSITNRDKEHRKHLLKRIERGETPQDWVVLWHVNLTKKEAQRIEADLLEKHRPYFNRNNKYRGLKFTVDRLRQAQFLRNAGYTYQRIADEMGFSAMTVHRALTGGTIAHQR